MCSLINVDELSSPTSMTKDENKCVIIKKSATRNVLKKKQYQADSLTSIEAVESKDILEQQVDSISHIFVELF